MKISLLTTNLSGNSLGRTYLLAKILQRNYEVEIIGPIFGDKIWSPVVNDKSITYKPFKFNGRLQPYLQIRKLAKEIDGDVIYASKPFFTSFGLGLLKKLFNDKKVILDIDDWQMGFIKDYYRRFSFVYRLIFLTSSALFLYRNTSIWNVWLCEKLAPLADDITVSNRFLHNKFGGTIIWHARNTDAFNSLRFDGNLLREKYGIPNKKKVVMFFGTPRPHKGIEDLIKAVSLIEDSDVVLVIVGIDESDQYSKILFKTMGQELGQRFIGFGLQPFESVPNFLAMADVVVIPQRKSASTVGQTPAKVFDAMAMEKPIVATSVSDLPEILNGCGWIVEPENPIQLAESIQYALNNKKDAEEMGWKARQKCVEKYSWDAMECSLSTLFKKYETP